MESHKLWLSVIHDVRFISDVSASGYLTSVPLSFGLQILIHLWTEAPAKGPTDARKAICLCQ